MRNDAIPGQGLQVLVDAKALKIKANALDRLYHEFHKVAEKEHIIDYDGFLEFLEIDNTPYTDIFFLLMDRNKDGEFNFWEYILCLWNFLGSSEDNLPATIFTLFDVENTGVLEIFEVKYMLQLVYIFKPPIFARWAIEKLNLNEDGLCTIAEFVLLCRHHPVLLLPIVNMRKNARKRIVHSRFWREIANIRMSNFGSHSIFDILSIKNAREIKLHVLEHLTTRDDIPLEYKDKWRDLQVKKSEQNTVREHVTEDLPPETLTEVQKGLRLMFPDKWKDPKQKEKSAFAHLHPDFNDESALLDSSDDRVNRLVENLKAQQARLTANNKRASKAAALKDKKHNSVKNVLPGVPTQAAPASIPVETPTAETRRPQDDNSSYSM